jgi:hypothetical protein
VRYRHGLPPVLCTITENEHDTVLPEASLAVQLTVFVPIGNVEPEAGEHETEADEQLSVTVGFGYVTGTEHLVVFLTWAAGQVIEGGWLSTTRTVNEQDAVLPEASPAVQVTVFVPTENVEPDGGEQITVAEEQASLALGAKVTMAPHRPVAALLTMLAGQAIVGARASRTVNSVAHVALLPVWSVPVTTIEVAPTPTGVPAGGL